MEDNQEFRNPGDIAGAPLTPQIKSDPTTYNAFQATNAPAEPKAKATIEESAELLHKDGPLKNLRTFESDIAEAIKDQQASAASIVAAEQKKHEGEIKKEDPKINIFLLGVSSILILGSITAFLYYYIIVRNRPQKLPPVNIDPHVVISTEEVREVTVSSAENLLSVFAQEKSGIEGNPGSLIRVSFVETATTGGTVSKKPIDAQTFATRLETGMQSWLVRSLAPEYVAGYHMQESGPQPFIVFKIASYENAFAGMLKWESSMKADLAILLPAAPEPTPVATTTATTTKKKTAIKPAPAPAPEPTTFIDIVVRNKDVRALKNSAGTPILLYSFPDRETLVITTSDATLKELFARLVTSQFVR